MLIEVPLHITDAPMSETATELIAKGRALIKSVDCFDFVPSDYELAWRVLRSLPRGRFCEWGSGLGIVTGLAELLGFEAHGIEIDAKLADTSRRLLAECHLRATIEVGDYLTSGGEADVYFVYCWPGKTAATEAHFEAIAPQSARLLVCHGQSDIRCKLHEQGSSVMLQQNKDLVRRYIEEVLNTGAVELVPHFIAANHVNHNDPTGGCDGIAGMQRHIEVFRRTYPDIRVTIEDQIAEGDFVVSRLTYQGTHQGRWLGLQPTGKPITLKGAKIVKLRDGLIAESWGFFNTLEALREIGALRFPGEAHD
jgi:steroid delta-isomerase-like uncharacterized protein